MADFELVGKYEGISENSNPKKKLDNSKPPGSEPSTSKVSTKSQPQTYLPNRRSLDRFQFVELNLIHRGDGERTTNLVRRAIRMGYDSVVVNTDIGEFCLTEKSQVDGSTDEPVKKKRKNRGPSDELLPVSKDFIPQPFKVDQSKLNLSQLEVAGKKFRQFTRLTATIDSNSIHKFQRDPRIQIYDIVAVRVPDEQLLITLQRKGEFVDLITIDANHGRIPWLIKQKIIQSCTAVGISFEICYSNALYSSENRRQFFANARQLMEITRNGRGVVISSGAEDMMGIRGPFDVANLCVLFGLDPSQGRKFVSANGKEVLLRSESRKTIKGAVHVSNDILSIPSASGDPEQTLKELCSINEFRSELKNFNKPRNKEKNEESKKATSIFEVFQ